MSAKNTSDAILVYHRLEGLVNGENPEPEWHYKSLVHVDHTDTVSLGLKMEATKYLQHRLHVQTDFREKGILDMPKPEPGTPEEAGLEFFVARTAEWFEHLAEFGYIAKTPTLESLLTARHLGELIYSDVPCFA